MKISDLDLDILRNAHRKRTGKVRAQTRLTLQIKAICRSEAFQYLLGKGRNTDQAKKEYRKEADTLYSALATGKTKHPLATEVFPDIEDYLLARDHFSASISDYEKRMKKVVHTLSIWVDWVVDVRGMAELSFAQVVAEANVDLNKYPNPGKLWKRFGLAVFDGKAARKTKDKAKAVEMGYNPARRSVIHIVGDNFVRSRGKYKELYDERKAYELDRLPEKVNGKKVKGRKATAHKRALRYIEKRFLRDLWREWTGAGVEWKTIVAQRVRKTKARVRLAKAA